MDTVLQYGSDSYPYSNVALRDTLRGIPVPIQKHNWHATAATKSKKPFDAELYEQ
jgi:hypothetical protein